MLTPLPAWTQENPFKIKDSLYRLYVRAEEISSQPEALLLADTLYMQAVAEGDLKAQCLAYTFPVKYYNRNKDDEKMMEAVDRLREISRKNDYLQYYYYAWRMEIIYWLNKGQSLRALQRAEEMRTHAFEDKHDYGIFSSIRTVADVYNIRRNRKVACEYYVEALNYMVEHMSDQDPAGICVKIAECYLNDGTEAEKGLVYCDQAIRDGKLDSARLRAMIAKAFIYYGMRDILHFNEAYDEAMRLSRQIHYPATSDVMRLLRIRRLAVDGRYRAAMACADSFPGEVERINAQMLVSVASGDYKRAFFCRTALMSRNDSLLALTQEADLATLNAQIGNELLRQERSRLLLESNRNLTRFYITLFMIVMVVLCCFVFFLLYRHGVRRRAMIVLEKKNRELAVARDNAEAASRMKSVFIQNMSHEIRTPLNAIVGFSQLITDPTLGLDEEDKKAYMNIVCQNSDLLTTLINDLLCLSELESGTYKFSIAPASCNDICRMAFHTVMHRKPEGVNLYFTTDAPDDYLIMTDKLRVEQVLVNLLTNAEKFTEQGEIHLHCSLTEHSGYVTFSVADTGPGIAEGKEEVIFERFKKLDSFKQGVGLGLNICRIIADGLNSEVMLDRSYTGGARFVFILDAAKVKDGENPGESVPADEPSASKDVL